MTCVTCVAYDHLRHYIYHTGMSSPPLLLTHLLLLLLTHLPHDIQCSSVSFVLFTATLLLTHLLLLLLTHLLLLLLTRLLLLLLTHLERDIQCLLCPLHRHPPAVAPLYCLRYVVVSESVILERLLSEASHYFRNIALFAVDLAHDVQGLEMGHFPYPIWNQ